MQMGASMKEADREALIGNEEVERRWSEYFEVLLIVFDKMEANVGCLGWEVM